LQGFERRGKQQQCTQARTNDREKDRRQQAAATYGIEGVEKDILLQTIQTHREDTNDTPEEFRRRFARVFDWKAPIPPSSP
jgi:hypothetical protein